MNAFLNILAMLISPLIEIYRLVTESKNNKKNIARLAIQVYVEQSSWIVSGGKTKKYYSLFCEVVNHGEKGIFAKSVKLIHFDDLKEKSTVRVKVDPIKKLDPEIPVKISISGNYLTSFPKAKVALKVIVVDTLGRTYESKIRRVDLTKLA